MKQSCLRTWRRPLLFTPCAVVTLVASLMSSGVRAEASVSRAQAAHSSSALPLAAVTSGRSLPRELSAAVNLEPFFEEASRRYALPVCFLLAVARVESGFDPQVVSAKGAMGIMQLMPRTAHEMGVRNPYDARESILGGARYLRVLTNRWKGDMILTIASYNAGPTAVTRCRCVPPYRETRGYVQRVLRHYRAYRSGMSLARR
jgi:soluble lytic murein transglycosylase-like protein